LVVRLRHISLLTQQNGTAAVTQKKTCAMRMREFPLKKPHSFVEFVCVLYGICGELHFYYFVLRIFRIKLM